MFPVPYSPGRFTQCSFFNQLEYKNVLPQGPLRLIYLNPDFFIIFQGLAHMLDQSLLYKEKNYAYS